MPNEPQNELTLRSDLSELRRVVAWLDDVQVSFGIPEDTRFAMDLCLEEAISNVIRHGYSGSSDGIILIRYEAATREGLTLVVQDTAPAFNPLETEIPIREEPGGLGIRLIRSFTTSMAYERLERGNRLTMSFSWSKVVPTPR